MPRALNAPVECEFEMTTLAVDRRTAQARSRVELSAFSDLPQVAESERAVA
jgi:hypothetical protein